MNEFLQFTLGGVSFGMVYAAIALSLVLIEGIAGIIYGGQYRSFPAAFSVTGLHAGSVPLGISRNDVFVAAAVLVVALALAAMFRFTSAGLRLRAAAFNAYAARLLGVRVGRVLTLGWALAGLIGALAGLLVSPNTPGNWVASDGSATASMRVAPAR